MNSSFAVPEITLDRASLRSLRQQIFLQIAFAVHRGTFPNGTRLPSSRLLAKLLNISRNTVVEAYEELRFKGLLVAKPGIGVEISYTAPSTIPNFASLQRTARAAHYPVRTLLLQDPDGTLMYLNLPSGR